MFCYSDGRFLGGFPATSDFSDDTSLLGSIVGNGGCLLEVEVWSKRTWDGHMIAVKVTTLWCFTTLSSNFSKLF